MLRSVTTGDLLMINLGRCPHCNHVVPFMETEEKDIFTCSLCYKKAKQYVNGKVLYNKIIFDEEESEEYP